MDKFAPPPPRSGPAPSGDRRPGRHGPGLTRSPIQSDWAAPSGRPARRRSHTWIWLVTTTVISLATALVVGWYLFSPRLDWEHSEHGYDIIETKTASSRSAWSFQLPFPATASGPADGNVWEGVVDIYSDPQLTHRVDFVSTSREWGWTGWKATFSPFSKPVPFSANLPTTVEGSQIGNHGEWPAGTYYIVERRDLLNRVLDRPRVRVYQVVASHDQVGAPEPTMDVTENGIPRFSWSPVENAVGYSILKMDPSQTASAFQTQVIGYTDADTTTWLAVGQDRHYQDNRQNGFTIDSYNSDFQAFAEDGERCTPQDNAYQGMDPPAWNDAGLSYPAYAVVAVDELGNTSLPMPMDGAELIRDVPLSSAANTWKAMTADAGPVFFPETYPVTMGDCRTVFFPVEAQSLVSSLSDESVSLTYSITGTLLTDAITVPTKDKASSQVKKLGRKHGLRESLQAGPMQDLNSMSYEAAGQYGVGRVASTEEPSSAYTWNGTSEMVRHIAANMFAGNTAIDMSRFVADPDSPLIYDAANEAVLQNPYLTDTFPVVGIRDNILYVNYEISVEEREKSAQRIKNKVDKVVASIIKPGMSERQKALAINDYLAVNAVYDQAALEFSKKPRLSREDFVDNFPHSWDAAGVLLEGKGVCASCSLAYKALADAVGLTTVTVTGYADDSGVMHEWIKASINGKWWVIDPTWNSNMWEQTGAGLETYFALKDSETDRRPTNSFVVDTHIWDYETV